MTERRSAGVGNPSSRRRFIAVAAASVLGGCLGTRGGAGPGGATDGTPATTLAASTTRDPSAAANETRSDRTGSETTPDATEGSAETGATDDEASTAGDGDADGTGDADGDETDGDGDADASGASASDSGLHDRQYTTDLQHPVAEQLGREPTLGDYPAETDRIVLMFDDPSCSVCARFERGQMGTLVDRVIEPGKATFVSRNFPHTHEWSRPATYALESTYARDHETYWELRSHYFLEQERMTTDDVLERTASFLGDTPVDADAVVRDVENRAYQAAVELDLRLKRNAGIFATPVFFLFAEGEFVTRLIGNQSVSTIEAAIGL